VLLQPTSGLDARAAAIVMRGMRRIASSGRAVCATIHQPSVAIFNDFDTLLLLKRGGEVVFHGDLGKESSHLIEYLERFEATKKIQPGENPATWMLTVTGAGSAESKTKPFDYAGSYSVSKLREQCVAQIDQITAEAKEEGKIVYESSYAASRSTQNIEVLKRTMKIYFRSPSYNTSRMIVSGIVALLFASVYASDRVPKDEADMNSRVNSIFIAVLFLCVSALNTVLSFYETEVSLKASSSGSWFLFVTDVSCSCLAEEYVLPSQSCPYVSSTLDCNCIHYCGVSFYFDCLHSL